MVGAFLYVYVLFFALDLQGVFIKIGDFIKFKGFLVEFQRAGVPEKKIQNPQKIATNVDFSAPRLLQSTYLHTVETRGKQKPKRPSPKSKDVKQNTKEGRVLVVSAQSLYRDGPEAERLTRTGNWNRRNCFPGTGRTGNMHQNISGTV